MNKNIYLSLIAGIVIVGGVIWIYKSNTASVTNSVPDENSDTIIREIKNENQSDRASNIPSIDKTTNPSASDISENKVKTFVIQGKSFSFTPSTITVKNGDTVKIVFENIDGFHDFKIDEFGVATKRLQSGQQDTIEFIANKTGSFEYYCSVGQHRQMGMKGMLIVE
jgi:plastocyanin